MTSSIWKIFTALPLLIASLLWPSDASANTFQPDSISSPDHDVTHIPIHRECPQYAPLTLDSIRLKSSWWQQLYAAKFNVTDSAIQYPRFLKFCVDVYNWGDKFFNTYNPDYVLPTGKNWKFIIKNENWTDSYAMNLTRRVPIFMLSDIHSNLGAYLSFMAVSIGYSWDVSHLLGNKPANHRRFDFSFTCARFTGSFYLYKNNDGTNIKRLGQYENGKWVNFKFPGLKINSSGLDIYYFFNNKKFAYGAAYCFSKYQIKSAGSWLAGFMLDRQDISIDFSQLPQQMKDYLGNTDQSFRFYYNDYCLAGGYSYNWVFHKHWVFNISAMPAIGFKHSLIKINQAHTDTFSMNIKGRLALVYNIRNFFFGMLGRFDGYWYLDSRYSFFNAIETLSLNAGIRF